MPSSLILLNGSLPLFVQGQLTPECLIVSVDLVVQQESKRSSSGIRVTEWYLLYFTAGSNVRIRLAGSHSTNSINIFHNELQQTSKHCCLCKYVWSTRGLQNIFQVNNYIFFCVFPHFLFLSVSLGFSSVTSTNNSRHGSWEGWNGCTEKGVWWPPCTDWGERFLWEEVPGVFIFNTIKTILISPPWHHIFHII